MAQKIQLRDGGRYRLRNGSVITVDGCYYPFVNHDRQYHSYTLDGRYYANGRESQFDIISEVTEEKEESVKDWTIEVGKFYQCSSAYKWECLAIHGNVAFMATDYEHHAMVFCSHKQFLCSDKTIIGPWVDPLVINWL